MSAAPSVAEHKTKVAVAIVAGSVGLTSYNCGSTRRPSAQTHGRAIAIPAVIIISASRSTSHTVVKRVAPNLFPSNIPEFREIVLDYMAAMTKVGHCLVAGISLSLGFWKNPTLLTATRWTL
jgi:isopenicillin N synthase-like dioxygenase